MHRKDDDRDEGENLAGLSPFVAGSDRRLNAVIPFPRDRSAIGLANEGTEAASVPSPFIPLGNATAAVVMRLSKQFPRIKVLVADAGREESTRDES
ncbi:hypothetical protein JJQ51_16005 [Rhizobium sp. AG207R]|nr:hypothetical protein [Rhizobium sp. AG207R]